MFSILVPTYNQAQYLSEALDSLLDQTCPDWEAIVVNDGSTDHTEEVMRKYADIDPRIRVFSKENGGVSTALNLGIGKAIGEWICWLSSDDLFDIGKLQIHLDHINKHPEFRFHFTRFYVLDEDTKTTTEPIYIAPKPEDRIISLLSGNIVHGITMATHSSVFENVGVFDERLRYAQDFDMWLRIHSEYESLYIDEPTCTTRVHSGQGTFFFHDAGAYDSAWSCTNFLKRSKFEDVFPMLNLRNPIHLARALRKTLRRLALPDAFMYRCGYNPTLILRLEEWINGKCPTHIRPMVYLIILYEVMRSKKHKLPKEIKNPLRQLKYGGTVFDKRHMNDFLKNAESHVRVLQLNGMEEAAQSLKRYLETTEQPDETALERGAAGITLTVRDDEYPLDKSKNAADLVNMTVVTFNRLEFTRAALESVVRHTRFPYRLTVVDNGSTDGSVEYLEREFHSGNLDTLVLLDRNVGVARASNLGWHIEPSSSHYLKLDNDIVIGKDGWLRDMVLTQKDIPEIGAIAYKVETVDYPVRQVGEHRVCVKEFGNLGGACMLIPKRTENCLGYWTEEYGLYGEEDADYGIRIDVAGLYNIYMYDTSCVNHREEDLNVVEDLKYRRFKDKRRKRNLRRRASFNRITRAYVKGKRPLYVGSGFVDEVIESGTLVGDLRLKVTRLKIDKKKKYEN